MNWILLSLLPLPMVIFGLRSSFSAANGQFMMFKANVYHKLQPHSIVRSSAVEDIEIMTLYKKGRYRCATLLGDQRVQCRMYSGYREAIAGFSKNVLHFFSGSLVWALFYILFTTFGLIFLAFGHSPVSGCTYIGFALPDVNLPDESSKRLVNNFYGSLFNILAFSGW